MGLAPWAIDVEGFQAFTAPAHFSALLQALASPAPAATAFQLHGAAQCPDARFAMQRLRGQAASVDCGAQSHCAMAEFFGMGWPTRGASMHALLQAAQHLHST